jgi:ABC-2 type transport system ATP-binding protein
MTDSENTNWAIEVKDLCKSFEGYLAVNHVSLKIKKGEIFGFLGPNGSGKTTTMRMIAGLYLPDSGTGTCFGLDLITDREEIRQKMGYMTQKFGFYGDLSASENLKIF